MKSIIKPKYQGVSVIIYLKLGLFLQKSLDFFDLFSVNYAILVDNTYIVPILFGVDRFSLLEPRYRGRGKPLGATGYNP